MIEGTVFTAGLVMATILSVVLGGMTWQYRHRPGAKPFLLLVAGLALWTGTAFAGSIETDTERALLWYRLSYLGIPTVVLGWFLFSLEFSGRGEWITRRTLGLLAIQPVALQVAVWTNASHNLIWQDLSADPFAQASYGLGFWVHALYSYSLLLVGTLVLCSFVLYTKTLYRDQTAAILFAITIPWVVNILYLFTSLSVDLTPLALGVSAAAFGWSMLRYGFMDVVPVARETVLDEMNDGVLVLDTDQRVVDRNQAINPLLDVGDNSVVGKAVTEVLATDRLTLIEEESGRVETGNRAAGPPTPRSLSAFLAVAPSSECTCEVRLEMNMRDQPSRTYELTLSPFYAKKAARTGQLLVARDVTLRKRRERELAETTSALERQSREQTALIENLPGMVYRMPEPGSNACTFVSSGAVTVTGYQPATFESGRRSLQELAHEEERERVLERKRTAIARDERYDITYRIRDGDGGVRWIRDVGAGVNTSDGTLVTTVGVMLDVTSSKEREQLEVLNRVLRHNIRNEMNAIRGYTSLARAETTEAGRKHLDIVEKKSAAILRVSNKARVVQALLESRSGVDQPVDLVEGLRRALEQVDDRYGDLIRGHVTIETRGCFDSESQSEDPLEGILWVDSVDRLSRALYELLENAIVHDSGQPTLEIEIVARDRSVDIHIVDTGPGIPPDERDVLETKLESPLDHGSGLGLWICQWVLSPTGSLALEQDESGTRATVSLPRAELPPDGSKRNPVESTDR